MDYESGEVSIVPQSPFNIQVYIFAWGVFRVGWNSSLMWHLLVLWHYFSCLH